MATAQDSPNKPRPENWVIKSISDSLAAIHLNDNPGHKITWGEIKGAITIPTEPRPLTWEKA